MVAIRVAVGFPTSFRRVVLVAQPLGTLPVAVAVRTRETPTVAIA